MDCAKRGIIQRDAWKYRRFSGAMTEEERAEFIEYYKHNDEHRKEAFTYHARPSES